MFGIYLQMYNLHLKFRVKTSVSDVEMFHIRSCRVLTAFEGLDSDMEEQIPEGKSERGVLLLSALSPLLVGVCSSNPRCRSCPPSPLLYQQAFTRGKGI